MSFKLNGKVFEKTTGSIRHPRLRRSMQLRVTQQNSSTKSVTSNPSRTSLSSQNCIVKHQFLAVRWPRQTGKSTSIGALLLQDAYENNDLNIGFIGPSFRQTKLNLRRVAGFCRNLPCWNLPASKKLESASKTAHSSKPSQTTPTQSEATHFIGSGGMKPTSPQVTTTSTTPSYSPWEPQTAN